MIGRTLAHYRIESKLGEGGMGVVYRATDTHLDRFVAVKVLRTEAASSPERKRRFVQEAKSASALNHPNIVTIHDISSSDGIDFIVMEYVKGRPLDQIIGRKGLAISEVLRYAVPVADALTQAHGIGLVHRDLKPANIMVTEDGLVKVLDFGLAKLIEPEENDPSGTTLTMATDAGHTAEGVIVGTAAYMSPEQAEGRKIDARSDIFSFGAVLYEMITGRRAFQRETRLATLTAVVREAPAPLTETAGGFARDLERIVSLCLQKEPARRMQHMGDVKIALQHLREESESGRVVRAAAPARPRFRSTSVLAAGGLLIIGVAGFAAWRLSHPARRTSSAPVLTRLTADGGLTAYPALSPDGKLLAYASDRASDGNLDIWVQQTSGGNPIRLTTNPADDLEPSFSPDGARVAFRSEREGGGIYVAPAFGGVERRIADFGRSPRFSPDGKWIAYWVGDRSYFGRRQIFIVPAAGGEPRAFQPQFSLATNPIWAPDSRHLLFRAARDAAALRETEFHWWVAPIDGGTPVDTGAEKLLRQGSLPAQERSQLLPGFGIDPGDWSGDSVFFSAATGNVGANAGLWRVWMSSRYQIEGPVERLTPGTQNELQPAAAGTNLAFASLTQNENIWSLNVDATTARVSGGLQRLTSAAATDINPVLSTDGTKVAFASNRNGNLHVWIKDLTTGAESPLTSTAANDLPWLISPDGSRLVYCVYGSAPASDRGCFVVPMKGGAARKYCDDCPVNNVLGWSAGGRAVLYKKGLGKDSTLIIRDLDSANESVVMHDAKSGATAARFSPDGRWLSFQTVIEAATRRRLFVTPVRNGVAGGEDEWIPITDGSGLDRNAVWSPDGNLLYFLSERDGFRCIWAQRLEPTTKHPTGPAFAVYHLHQARRSLMPAQEVARIGLSVARDKIVFSMAETNGNVWLARVE